MHDTRAMSMQLASCGMRHETLTLCTMSWGSLASQRRCETDVSFLRAEVGDRSYEYKRACMSKMSAGAAQAAPGRQATFANAQIERRMLAFKWPQCVLPCACGEVGARDSVMPSESLGLGL